MVKKKIPRKLSQTFLSCFELIVLLMNSTNLKRLGRFVSPLFTEQLSWASFTCSGVGQFFPVLISLYTLLPFHASHHSYWQHEQFLTVYLRGNMIFILLIQVLWKSGVWNDSIKSIKEKTPDWLFTWNDSWILNIHTMTK